MITVGDVNPGDMFQRTSTFTRTLSHMDLDKVMYGLDNMVIKISLDRFYD